ncbi:rhomboid family intramembrane serine protease [Nocardioides aurantiacus]|uniref:rhomboid family intramembrane serine protease n=1 Tax=Nocardioides aurantiacus TaxID=86796 RepID=UPI00403F69D6
MSQLDTPVRNRRMGLLPAAVAMGVLVVVLWVLEGVDQATGNALDPYGIEPRQLDSLDNVLYAPWLHGGYGHLVSNTVPFFVLGVIVLMDGWGRWLRTSLVVVLVSGAAVWLLSPPGSLTLGASGVVFGWLTYLLVRGLYSRSPGQVATGVVLFVVYGGLLWGVLPSDAGVSWQAHAGGALGGLLAARTARGHRPD